MKLGKLLYLTEINLNYTCSTSMHAIEVREDQRSQGAKLQLPSITQAFTHTSYVYKLRVGGDNTAIHTREGIL